MSAFEGRLTPAGPGALQRAIDDGRYEEAALRLVVGVLRAIESTRADVPAAAEDLLALLSEDTSAPDAGGTGTP